jgi:hypothetical protein
MANSIVFSEPVKENSLWVTRIEYLGERHIRVNLLFGNRAT